MYSYQVGKKLIQSVHVKYFMVDCHVGATKNTDVDQETNCKFKKKGEKRVPPSPCQPVDVKGLGPHTCTR